MKMNFSLAIFLLATLLAQSYSVVGTEDEYEHDYNVVEHPGPTVSPVQLEVEETVVPVEPGSDDDEEKEGDEEVVQTTTYPVFDEPPSSTTTESNTLPLTSTTVGTTTTSTTSTTSATSTSTSTEISSTTSTAPFLPPHQRPVRSDLASMPPPTGQEILVGNVTIYESAVTNDTFEDVMLISVHDIFGFHPHVKYISDRWQDMATAQWFQTFFMEIQSQLKIFHLPKTAKYLFNKDGFWGQIKVDLLNVMNYYRQTANITSFGLYGFCWGGKMIVYASEDKDFQGINAIGFVHPSRLVTSDANKINAPALLLPSNAEPDMVPFLQILEQRFGEGKSEHYRYEDMRHGFAGATSDFSNPDVRSRVEDVIEKLNIFFRKHLV
ncbi:putative AIM2 family protein C30D10.14 [Orchesella cincta]|uniref:Putative AIM2 family protein C30D10.14 n=1 Tax=Orchesella cincta TaxID=48709 RepID=A0A1D2MZ25_ORCCI|nr:putative AIM2 family protein C30D10.14 [Orchesella cincta]